MRRLRCLWICLVIGMALVYQPIGLSEPARLLTRPAVPSDASLAPLGLKLHWYAYVGVAGRGDGLASAQVFGNQVVIQSLGGTITCLDAETGSRLWAVRPSDLKSSFRVPLAANQHIIVYYGGGRLFGLDRVSGAVDWTLDAPGVLSTFPAVDADHLFLATSDGRMHTYLLPMPKRQIARGGGAQATAVPISAGLPAPATLKNPFFIWSFRLDSPALEPPASFGLYITFADGTGQLMSFQNERRFLQDQVTMAAPIVAPLTAAGDQLFVASRDHSVMSYQIVAGNFSPRWRFLASSRIDQQPVVIGPDVFAVGAIDGMYCLSRDSGLVRWQQRRAAQFLAASTRLVFARDDGKKLLTLDRLRGTVINQWDASAFAHFLTNTDNDRVVLANDDGLVLCLRDRDPAAAKPSDYRTQPDLQPKTPAPTAEKPAEKEQDRDEQPKEDKPMKDNLE
jgi:outer membrane protein assembly factor BamB